MWNVNISNNVLIRYHWKIILTHWCDRINIIGDIINEYYGAKATKATVYIGLAMSILVFGVMNLAQALPYLDKPFNGNTDRIFSYLVIHKFMISLMASI